MPIFFRIFSIFLYKNRQYVFFSFSPFALSIFINFIPFNTWWGILIWAVLIAALVAAFVFLYKNMDAINSWFNKKFKFARRKKAGKASGKSADEKEKDKE